MDHLVRGSHPPTIQVAYLCTKSYDNPKDWIDYPQEQKVALEDLRFHLFFQYEPRHLESVLQNWLFFGLLSAILPEFDEQDFLISRNGQTLVTTEKLNAYLRGWYDVQAQASNTTAEKHVQFYKNLRILDEARHVVSIVSDYLKSSGINLFPALPPSVALSCAIVGETLELANKAILDPNNELRSPGEWSTGSLLLEHMEIQGWCPFIVADLERDRSLHEKYYLATIGPPLVERNHQRCSDWECRAKEFLPQDVQHTTSGCGCKLHEIPIQDLRALIEPHKTPILKFDYDGQQSEGRLNMETADTSTPYVAISHVWVDGLGNPNNNSMPHCQLKRVQEKVKRLYRQSSGDKSGGLHEMVNTSAWFWIDTLCVPNRERDKDLNREALDYMKEIYVQADKVLVIDSEVVAHDLSDDPYKLLSRIRLSNWLR
jgi:hypothetical protein